MQLASIVPIRRLPDQASFFDYLWPNKTPIVAGQIARIPFGKSSINGLVLGPSQEQASLRGKYRSIHGLVTPHPVVSTWQLQQLQNVSRHYDFPLGTLLSTVLPKKIPDAQPITQRIAPAPSQSQLIWYGQRSVVESAIERWLGKAGRRLLIVPTVEDAEAWAARFSSACLVTGTQTPKQYREAYQGVLSGQIRVVIGTGKALWLPWPVKPAILLDRPEHAAYRQTKSRPVFVVPRALERLGLTYVATTPAPTLRQWKPSLTPPPAQHRRTLGSLGRGSSAPWVSTELTERLAVEAPPSIVALFPARGFANSLSCGDCGTIIRCPSCHRAIRLLRHDATHSRCQSCGHLAPLPSSCPSCHGQSWKYSGLSPDRWQSHVAKAGLAAVNFQLLYYADAQHLPSAANRRLVIVPAGDSIFHSSDYASSEHAWQLMATIGSQLKRTDELLIQTFEPQSTFWQRWVNGETQAFYRSELLDRKKHRLPPSAAEWIVAWPSRHPEIALEAAQDAARRSGYDLRWRPIIDRSGVTPRWVVSSHGMKTLDTLIPHTVFPAPWRVDIDSETWLP